KVKAALFSEHDLFVTPSLTDISPNSALEARSAGLPVLLTNQTGLSKRFTDGMLLRDLTTPEHIINGLKEARANYPLLALQASTPVLPRSWSQVARELLELFSSLL